MQERHAQAIDLMERFAERTALGAEHAQRRYLWTDAYAVCNFLGLAQATGERRFLDLALRLIAAVHATLGRHRPDDARSGWVSGFSEEQGAAHPTHGGLRIGKNLPERGPTERFDEALEWDRDGQYFHYLTKWMHALDQATRATGDWTFNVWARELAETAYEAFTYGVAGADQRRMYWKMSIDLLRPLVPSMGQHDPLDGYITYVQLHATARAAPEPLQNPHVGDKADQFAAAMDRSNLRTADPLGLGGLLIDAARVAQLAKQGMFHGDDLVGLLLTAAAGGLTHYERQAQLGQPATRRLPFREIGLALGLRAVQLVADADHNGGVAERLAPFQRYLPLLTEIESFWRNEEHRCSPTWTEHRDINEVMYATALVPDGLLLLREPPREPS